MSNPMAGIVEHEACPFKTEPTEQEEWKGSAPSTSQIRKRIDAQVRQVFAFLEKRRDRRSFHEVETALLPMICALGRLFLTYFFTWRQEHSGPRVARIRLRGYHQRDSQPRQIGTLFGKVRYWRTYLREKGGGGGVYPLDLALKLTRDGFSWAVMGLSSWLATAVSYDRAVGVFQRFYLWAPSKTSVEHMVLGLGRYTAEWFEAAPPPEGDGEVLVIQIDSKATPTATEAELERRRGKRRPNPWPDSPRHRGRKKRTERAPRRRRTKGEKAKNGRAATLVVLYTLKRSMDKDGNPLLLGPINRQVYASYAPKRHAVAIARREADKRGFDHYSGRTIQVVTDGDEDLEGYIRDTFPEAMHTLDVMHALEYVWKAGECLYAEGSKELLKWVERMKKRIYSGKVKRVISEIRKMRSRIARTGPGTRGKRTRLDGVIKYLEKRIDMMNYGYLIEEDFEIATGSVEGAVKHVIGKRLDNGSMRWIKERAEPLLQLRSIEINGDWERFIEFVQDRLSEEAEQELEAQTLLNRTPGPLPTVGVR